MQRPADRTQLPDCDEKKLLRSRRLTRLAHIYRDPGSSATGLQGSCCEEPRYTSQRAFDYRRRGILASYPPRRVLRLRDDSRLFPCGLVNNGLGVNSQPSTDCPRMNNCHIQM